MNNLEQKIEAILFYKGEPINLKKLTDILKVPLQEVRDAIFSLKANLKNRGIILLEKDDEITLGTAPEFSEMIENLQKEELSKDLSKATLETLSIVLYKNGATRAEVDYIRGVNSTFTLRALSVRGLVEKIQDPSDNRRFIYKPTFELLSFMGVTSVEELPEYQTILVNLDQTIKNPEENV